MSWLKNYQNNIYTTSFLAATTSLFLTGPRKLQSSCTTRTESVLTILRDPTHIDATSNSDYISIDYKTPHMIELKRQQNVQHAPETHAGMHLILYKHLKSYFQSALMPLLYAQISAYYVHDTTLVRNDSTFPFILSVVSLCFVQG